LNRSAVILAGGLSSRFGRDKGLLQLAGKPLVRHVLDAVDNVVDDRIVVVSCMEQVEKYLEVADAHTSIIADNTNVHSPLAGALAGFEKARGEYSLLLPCDTPFALREVLSLLLELCTGRNACVPRWPNGYAEPLQAVYRTRAAVQASNVVLRAGEFNMQAMLNRLQSVRYVSTLVLEQVDPELKTFFNINTPSDLKKAEQMLNRPG